MAKGFTDSKGNFRPTGKNGGKSKKEKSVPDPVLTKFQERLDMDEKDRAFDETKDFWDNASDYNREVASGLRDYQIEGDFEDQPESVQKDLIAEVTGFGLDFSDIEDDVDRVSQIWRVAENALAMSDIGNDSKVLRLKGLFSDEIEKLTPKQQQEVQDEIEGFGG